jgi:hypothetical protein
MRDALVELEVTEAAVDLLVPGFSDVLLVTACKLLANLVCNGARCRLSVCGSWQTHHAAAITAAARVACWEGRRVLPHALVRVPVVSAVTEAANKRALRADAPTRLRELLEAVLEAPLPAECTLPALQCIKNLTLFGRQHERTAMLHRVQGTRACARVCVFCDCAAASCVSRRLGRKRALIRHAERPHDVRLGWPREALRRGCAGARQRGMLWYDRVAAARLVSVLSVLSLSVLSLSLSLGAVAVARCCRCCRCCRFCWCCRCWCCRCR